MPPPHQLVRPYTTQSPHTHMEFIGKYLSGSLHSGPTPKEYSLARSFNRQYRGSWPTAIALVAHVPTTTPPERELHAGKGTPRALSAGAPVMSVYARTYRGILGRSHR
jgi:hypothetical protein